MATDFIMPRLPDQSQTHGQLHYYTPHLVQQQSQSPGFLSQSETPTQLPAVQEYQPPSQQVSPLSTSNNASPTSPKSYHGRQLRPIFMPAVLRPTEHTSKAPGRKSEEQEGDSQLKTNGSFISLGGLSALGRLSRRSTGDSGKCVDGDWNLEMFPKPTAQPTRQHWKVS